jgi:hypothetical protein
MRLADAYNLLMEDGIADNHRYFAEVYKNFQFKDEDTLKDYVDFILHEPTHWMRGFPPKLTSKNAFAKPKTAVIKLLKKTEVQADLGEAAAELAHTTIWTVFKRDHEKILEERQQPRRREAYRNIVEHLGDTEEPITDNTITDTSNNDEENRGPMLEVQDDDITVHEEPLPPLHKSFMPGQQYINGPPTPQSQQHEKHHEQHKTQFDDTKRIEVLKAVCGKLAETLPPSVSDAFRMLIDAV